MERASADKGEEEDDRARNGVGQQEHGRVYVA